MLSSYQIFHSPNAFPLRPPGEGCPIKYFPTYASRATQAAAPDGHLREVWSGRPGHPNAFSLLNLSTPNCFPLRVPQIFPPQILSSYQIFQPPNLSSIKSFLLSNLSTTKSFLPQIFHPLTAFLTQNAFSPNISYYQIFPPQIFPPPNLSSYQIFPPPDLSSIKSFLLSNLSTIKSFLTQIFHPLTAFLTQNAFSPNISYYQIFPPQIFPPQIFPPQMFSSPNVFLLSNVFLP